MSSLFGPGLDALIGMAFLFYLLTLLVSSVLELIAGWFSWRGTYLLKGIDMMLADRGDDFGFANIADWLAAHFSASPGRTLAQSYDAAPPATPNTPAQRLQRRLYGLRTHPLITGSSPRALPSYVSARNFCLALEDLLIGDTATATLSGLQQAIATLPDAADGTPGALKRTLSIFARDAAGDLTRFRAAIEAWFNESMDRVTGIYKRLAQRGTFLLGLIVASTLNVDSVHVLKYLWSQPNQSQVIAIAAKEAVDRAASLPAPATPNAPTPTAATPAAQALPDQLLARLEALNFPIGWQCWADADLPATTPPTPPGACPWTETVPQNLLDWTARDRLLALRALCFALPGWVFTAFAISFGGPFWLDLIGSLAKLRGAGPNPEATANPTRRPPPAA